MLAVCLSCLVPRPSWPCCTRAHRHPPHESHLHVGFATSTFQHMNTACWMSIAAPPQAGVQPGLDDSIKAGDSAPAYGGQIAADAPYLALSGQDLDRQDDAASVLSGGAQSSWVAMRAYSICTACHVACKQGSSQNAFDRPALSS